MAAGIFDNFPGNYLPSFQLNNLALLGISVNFFLWGGIYEVSLDGMRGRGV